jgi:hypothetical protein
MMVNRQRDEALHSHHQASKSSPRRQYQSNGIDGTNGRLTPFDPSANINTMLLRKLNILAR